MKLSRKQSSARGRSYEKRVQAFLEDVGFVTHRVQGSQASVVDVGGRKIFRAGRSNDLFHCFDILALPSAAARDPDKCWDIPMLAQVCTKAGASAHRKKILVEMRNVSTRVHGSIGMLLFIRDPETRKDPWRVQALVGVPDNKGSKWSFEEQSPVSDAINRFRPTKKGTGHEELEEVTI